VKPLLDFGIAAQMTNVVFIAAGLAAPVVVGRWGSEKTLGLVLWALGNAERPKPLLEVIARVAFPSYARLSASPETLRAGLDRTLHGALLATCAYGGLLAGVAPVFVPLVFTATWTAAISYLYVYIALFPLVTMTVLLDVTFLARGDSRLVRNVHLVRLALSWALAIPAMRFYGVPGYLAGHATALSTFALCELWFARSFASPWFIARVAAAPLVGGVAAAIAARFVVGAALPPLMAVALAVLAGGAAYLVPELVLDRSRLRATLRLLTGWR
jgi:O-antigen/teichoic acid export membrane protein